MCAGVSELAERSDSRAVYNTQHGRLCPQCQRAILSCVCGADRPASVGDNVIRIHRETKGRGGKAVTVIAGIPETADTLKSLCKQLKRRCGVGGSVKAARIEIQGDQRTLCQQHLESLGYEVKLSGG